MPLPRTLIVVPARAGSKGVRRKNLRPVAGVPLFLRACQAAKDGAASAGVEADVVVSTDDPDVASLAAAWGFEVVDRDHHHAGDDSPVDRVAVHAAEVRGHDGPVMLFQPTCATFPAVAVAEMLDQLETTGSDSVVAATPHEKLLWREGDGPLFTGEQRANRQVLRTGLWREVGVFLTRELAGVSPFGSALIDGDVSIYETPAWCAHDIDTHADLLAASAAAGTKPNVGMVVAVGDQFGSGHVRRAVELIALFLDWAGEVFVDTRTPSGGPPPLWAVEALHRAGGQWVSSLAEQPVDLVVWDALDSTLADHVDTISRGIPLVCIEDLGPGALAAAATINELYDTGTHVGPAWSVIRPDIRFGRRWSPDDASTGKALVTFGGTDPSHLTERVARLIGDVSVIVEPPGRSIDWNAPGLRGVPWTAPRSPLSMAAEMARADMVVTSAGRTCHEAAYLGCPVVSIAANARESTHALVRGVVSLGWHGKVSDDTIESTIRGALEERSILREMHEAVSASVDGLGAERVSDLCARVVSGHHR